MARRTVEDLLREPAAAVSRIDIVEHFANAPAGLVEDGLSPGFHMVLAGRSVELTSGVLPDLRGEVEIHSHWEDTATAALLRNGPDYQALAAERLASGRLHIAGVMPPDVHELLVLAHDRIAAQTDPYEAKCNR